ncbi:TetR/AcrR family transcriptional regulator [Streptomyces lancefieldiae]|uniref:TetR/AcrR family transcriptional regulator n=1 Tax=Streptomyces lancefieldiae TaxID=3075520 RepID=A0ABU3AYX1_9ACTN|nr:TetR/AcrR family transcriptional regulator [Streptomyces sp. DSM 40712]MDT0615382.1 TetR/AcrR family transcriptional regulator [Streptomyces sp. DSM 40712]
MVKQQRAARTREALVQAAAAAFDLVGYEAASLAHVSKSAGISMGALTFHFPTKETLATAVQVRGASTTRAATEHLRDRTERPLRTLIDLTLELARLLDEDVAVRAAARLTRECPRSAAPWTDEWLPTAKTLLEHAAKEELRPHADAEALLTLTTHLVTGTESHIRRCALVPGERESAQEQLCRIWQLVLAGISRDPDALL